MPTDLAMFNDDARINAATHVELRRQAHETGRNRAGKMLEDFVRDGLVEGTAIAKRDDIELE
jgi:hypothetical protein